ncbi:MAG: hypothetical protein JXP34_18145 [Planctomycetes bacterium]|nr:hypothetical protein [Planctomycetota bacterium]
MAKKAAGRRPKKRKPSALDRLEPGEAQGVLEAILKEHPHLRERAEEIARSVIGDVSFEDVAGEVEWALTSLDLDDLNSRAGRHSWGYVGPGEAAWELLQEAIDPIIQDMDRQMDLGLAREARESCKGLLLGLYTVRKCKGDGCLAWAPDFPAQTAGEILEKWGAGREGRKKARRLPRSFLAKHLAAWSDLFGESLVD